MTENKMLVTLTTEELSEVVTKAVKKALDAERERNEKAEKEVYLTRKEVISLLKISPVTFWKLCKSQTLEAKKIGRKVLVLKSSVMAAQAAKL